MGKSKNKKKFLVGKVRKGTKGTDCQYCDRILADDAALKTHIAQAHGFKCTKCPKRFPNEPSWVNHLRDGHGISHSQGMSDFRKAEISDWLKKVDTKSKKKKKRKVQLKGSENDITMNEETPMPEVAILQIICADCGRRGPKPFGMMLGIVPRCPVIGWGPCTDDDDI